MNNRSVATGTACLLSALAGYLLANQSTSGNGKFGDSQNQYGSSRVERLGMDYTRAKPVVKRRTAKQLATLNEQLRKEIKDSPAAKQDWVLRGRIQAILATLSEEELQELVKDDITLPAPGSMRSWNTMELQFFEVVIAQWASLNPEGACQALLGKTSHTLSAAFGQWQKQDPKAAQDWLTHADFPEEQESLKNRLMLGLLEHQVATDFSAAMTGLASLDSETQKKALVSWSQLVARDPTRRQEFLALLASRGDAASTEACVQSLVKEMARQSPAEAATFVEASDLPEKKKDELSHTLLGEWALKQPKEAFSAWADLKEDSAPEPLLRAIDSWSLNSPGAEDSIEWMNGLDPGPAREQFKTRLIDGFRKFDRYGQAADLSASIEDPAERIRQLKLVKRVWQEGWKPGCDAWFAKLPEETRNAVDGE